MSQDHEVKNVDREILKALQDMNEERIKTKALSKELSEKGVGGEHYIKVRLHTMKDWLSSHDGVETFLEEDNTGGRDTRFWRLDN